MKIQKVITEEQAIFQVSDRLNRKGFFFFTMKKSPYLFLTTDNGVKTYRLIGIEIDVTDISKQIFLFLGPIGFSFGVTQ